MSTYGYEYSFAVPELELAYTDQDTECGFMIRLNATMSTWQLIKDSQNSSLRFSIPLLKGELNIEGPIPGNYDLANVTILIEVTSGVPEVAILDPYNKLGTGGKRLLRHYMTNALFENKQC
jgi:hypothetical protein